MCYVILVLCVYMSICLFVFGMVVSCCVNVISCHDICLLVCLLFVMDICAYGVDACISIGGNGSVGFAGREDCQWVF